MSTHIIVIRVDGTNDDRSEVQYFDTPEEASRSIESLLEAGCEPEEIRVFTASEMVMGITHRPVVALTDAWDSSHELDDSVSEPRLSDALRSA